MVAFNDLGRAADPATTAIHFCKADKIFQAVLRSPLRYLEKAIGFGALCYPDITLTLTMRPWQRIQRIVWVRQVAATWESRGGLALSFLRWINPSDYDVVASGIPRGSQIAVSRYASIRDSRLAFIFTGGLPAMIERIEPSRVLVLGGTDDKIFRQLKGKTEFVPCLYPAWGSPKPARRSDTQMTDLFDGFDIAA
jgi:hypothetical protein